MAADGMQNDEITARRVQADVVAQAVLRAMTGAGIIPRQG